MKQNGELILLLLLILILKNTIGFFEKIGGKSPIALILFNLIVILVLIIVLLTQNNI